MKRALLGIPIGVFALWQVTLAADQYKFNPFSGKLDNVGDGAIQSGYSTSQKAFRAYTSIGRAVLGRQATFSGVSTGSSYLIPGTLSVTGTSGTVQLRTGGAAPTIYGDPELLLASADGASVTVLDLSSVPTAFRNYTMIDRATKAALTLHSSHQADHIRTTAISNGAGNLAIGGTGKAYFGTSFVDVVTNAWAFIKTLASSAANYVATFINNTSTTNARSEIGFQFDGASPVASIGAVRQTATTSPLVFSTMTSGTLAEKFRIAGRHIVAANNSIVTIGQNSYPLSPTPAAIIVGNQSAGASAQLLVHRQYTSAANSGGGGILLYHNQNNNKYPNKDNRLGYFLFGGLNASLAGINGGGIAAYAEENWSATAGGTRFQFETMPNGSTTRVPRLTIKNDGKVGIGTTTPAALFDVYSTASNKARVRVGSATNYGVFDQALGLRYAGQTTTWDDSMVPATLFRTGGTALTFADVGNGIYLNRFDVGDIVYIQFQLPHKMKTGTTIYPHLHVVNSSAIGATNYNVSFATTQSWTNIGQVFPTVTTVNPEAACSLQNAAQYTHTICPFASITPTATQGGISSYIIWKIERITSSSQPLSPATSLFVLGADLHFSVDSTGSDEEYSKQPTP